MQQSNNVNKPRFFLVESGADTYKVEPDGRVRVGSLMEPELWYESLLKEEDIEMLLKEKHIIQIYKRGI